MSEWTSVFAVFWVLWVLDGIRLGPRRSFTWTGMRARAWAYFSRLSLAGWWPAQWRVTTEDVPLSMSPEGISNRPVGCAGRPAETVENPTAWRWADIREVGVARGWIFVNGRRFLPATGHLTAPELLALAGLPAKAREARIRWQIARWFRPAHVVRRTRVLEKRTELSSFLNQLALGWWLLLTAYVVGDVASRLSGEWSERMIFVVLAVLLGLGVIHLIAVIATWRVVKRLPALTAQKRGTALFSALLLPPQAMRLRTLSGEGYFPAQHPLAVALALARPRLRDEMVFNVLTDLQWPVGTQKDAPLVQEIARWFGGEVQGRIQVLLKDRQIDSHVLLGQPKPDAAESMSYCPRCRAQFVGRDGVCPNGVPLRPLSRR